MRLIDADTLIENLKNMCCADNSIQRRKIVDSTLHELMPQVIDDEPTVEAEPVKHGRWIFKSRNKLINTGKLFVSSRVYTPKSLPASEFCEIPRGSYFFKKVHKTIQIPFCSRCENRGGDNECDISKYCPECGARMDGDET